MKRPCIGAWGDVDNLDPVQVVEVSDEGITVHFENDQREFLVPHEVAGRWIHFKAEEVEGE
ncbi:hypothetical protein [Streptomyces chattanoogensis]|uniref:hypothetical protein n=1 Tax=Streptomyces chattanoogensis TaxID=66876 RepID=UPI0036917522